MKLDKKKIIIIAAVVGVVVIGTGIGLYLHHKSSEKKGAKGDKEKEEKPAVAAAKK